MSERANRSARAHVRNPVLALPAIQALQALEPELRALLAVLLLDLRRDARTRADKSWASRKAFMAAYWSVVAVYAGHVAAALGPAPGGRRPLGMIVRQANYPDLPAADWSEASELFAARRDRSGLGASMFPDAEVLLADIVVGRISYNGRIWPPKPWHLDVQPIHDNRVVAEKLTDARPASRLK